MSASLIIGTTHVTSGLHLAMFEQRRRLRLPGRHRQRPGSLLQGAHPVALRQPPPQIPSEQHAKLIGDETSAQHVPD